MLRPFSVSCQIGGSGPKQVVHTWNLRAQRPYSHRMVTSLEKGRSVLYVRGMASRAVDTIYCT